MQQHVLSAQGHLPIAAAMIASKISKPSDPAAPQRPRRGCMPHHARYPEAHAAGYLNPELLGIEGEAASSTSVVSRPCSKKTCSPNSAGPGLGGRGEAPRPHQHSAELCLRARLRMYSRHPHVRARPQPGSCTAARNKPALALDLMEEFRAVIADSVVVSLINRKQVKAATHCGRW